MIEKPLLGLECTTCSSINVRKVCHSCGKPVCDKHAQKEVADEASEIPFNVFYCPGCKKRLYFERFGHFRLKPWIILKARLRKWWNEEIWYWLQRV